MDTVSARTSADGYATGRGPTATADMKARIAALRRDGRDVLDVLWRRHLDAINGSGYVYDFVERAANPSQSGRRR